MNKSFSAGFKRQLSNVVWMVTGRLIKAAVTFVLGIFVARYLGPDRFGILNYAIGLSMLFGIFSSMGTESVLVRELVNSKASSNQLLGSAFLIRVIGGTIALMLTGCMLLVTRADTETWLLTLICASSFFLLPFEVLRGFNEAETKGKTIVIVESVQCLFTSLLKLYFIAIQGDVYSFALCFLLEKLFLGIGFSGLYQLYEGQLSDWRIDVATLKHLFRESMPIMLSGMVIVVYQQIDKVMLKNMLELHGNEQIGYYSVALRILPFVLLIPQMMARAFFPSIVESHSTDADKYRERMQLYNDLMIWVGIFLTLCLCAFSGLLISFYGAEYSSSISLLRVVAFKGVFVPMSLASGSWILVNGLQKWAIYRNLAGCFLNIGLNFLWIPRWQAYGSAWATVLSLSMAAFIAHIFIPDLRPVFFIQVRSLVGGVPRLCQYALVLLRMQTKGE